VVPTALDFPSYLERSVDGSNKLGICLVICCIRSPENPIPLEVEIRELYVMFEFRDFKIEIFLFTTLGCVVLLQPSEKCTRRPHILIWFMKRDLFRETFKTSTSQKSFIAVTNVFNVLSLLCRAL
jgi:hypothetical protein